MPTCETFFSLTIVSEESEEQHFTIRDFDGHCSYSLVTKTSSSLTAPLKKVFLLSASSFNNSTLVAVGNFSWKNKLKYIRTST